MKTPYIKPTRHTHESGFGTFEVGYILDMSKENTVTKKEVLGEWTDHIYQDYMMIIGKTKPFCLNMDLTRDGYIRFFVHERENELRWDGDYDGFALSSMGLELRPKKTVDDSV